MKPEVIHYYQSEWSLQANIQVAKLENVVFAKSMGNLHIFITIAPTELKNVVDKVTV